MSGASVCRPRSQLTERRGARGTTKALFPQKPPARLSSPVRMRQKLRYEPTSCHFLSQGQHNVKKTTPLENHFLVSKGIMTFWKLCSRVDHSVVPPDESPSFQ